MDGSLSWVLDDAIALEPDRTAVVDGDLRRSYAEIGERCARLAGALEDLGVAEGGVVGILALNSAVHLELWLGIPRAGRVMNDLNFRLAPAELAFILDDCDTRVLVVDDAHLQTGLELLERAEKLERLVLAGAADLPDGVLRYEDLLAAAAPQPPSAAGGDDLAGIFYTGGTTGLPKGVMLSHANLVVNAKHMMIALPYAREDVYLHAAPMFHLADGASTYALTWAAGTHVIVPAFDPALVARTIEAERITKALLVPTMINMLINHPAVGQHDLSSLQRVLYGASPMPAEVQRACAEKLGCEMAQAYGMTEAAPIVTVLSAEAHTRGLAGEEPWATRLRSAGRQVPGVRAEVRRADGTRCDPGEAGEIYVQGPNVMQGYWNRPEETEAALVGDGWYRSGDMAYADEGGYLFVVDRAKDMIISGGENIYSVEVENAIYEHAAVLEAAVIGVPDERWGERVHAVVVLRESVTCDEEEIVAHCRERIAGYKLPRSVEFRAEPLPKSGAGKVLKRDLRDAHWSGHDRAVN
jgi:long-chain acyl-CoA synthetase